MSRLRAVVRREFLERVRSKIFLIGTFVGPLLMLGLFLLPVLVMSKSRGQPLRLAIVDLTGALEPRVREALGARKAEDRPRFEVAPPPAQADAEELRAEVLAGRLDGYVVLPSDALTRSVAEYHARNVSNLPDQRLLEEALSQVLVDERLAGEGIDAGRVRVLTRPLDLKTIRVSPGGDREDSGTSFLFSITLMMLLYTTVLMWGQALMTSVIEEKSSRVVEVMVSGIDSGTLLTGKLLGVGAAGLLQLLVWTATLGLLSLYGGGIAGMGSFRMPEVSPLLLASFVVFFLLGYFLYAALYAAVGASVNSVQEAQGLAFFVVMPMVVAVMFFSPVLQSPNGGLAIGLSLVPFFSPVLMFLRITAVTPPAWQIALSVVLSLLAIAAVIWVAARIYRVGILMYGKRPTFPEILRWVRHS